MSIRRLSVNDMRRVLGASFKQNRTITWHGNNLVVRQFLPLNEYMQMINNISNDCQGSDGEFAPELLDFAIKTNTIISYAFVELPADIGELFDIVYGTDLYDTVCKYANSNQIDSVKRYFGV